LSLKGAREHNLKNIDIIIARDQLVVITGLSGSGKSSLAFDTILQKDNALLEITFCLCTASLWENVRTPRQLISRRAFTVISIRSKTVAIIIRVLRVGTVTENLRFSAIGLYARGCPFPYSLENGLQNGKARLAKCLNYYVRCLKGSKSLLHGAL